MLPGDVYYYSSNSLVLCVKQNPDECDPEPQLVTRKPAGLNPNASVFHSNKAPSPPEHASTWDGVNEFQYTNGDVTPTEQGGGFGIQPDSPLQGNEGGALFGEGQVVYSPDSNVDTDESIVVPSDGPLDEESLRSLLKTQLELCISRESLEKDTYLQSQMDADQYVPIATLAGLKQITSLSSDAELITQLLRESPHVQVDEKGEKVRPTPDRCIVMLREVPESTPIEEVHQLFSGENCPQFTSCIYAGNNNWYVTFDSDAAASSAYQYLRNDVVTFLGKPIMARIKAKRPIRLTRNGYRSRFHEQQQQQQQQQVSAIQPTQHTPVQTTPMPPHSEASQNTTQQQQQQHYPIQQQVPLMSNVQQYINNQQAIPFFAPNPLLSQWTANPTVLDPSMVLAINGYQATSVQCNLKPNVPPRHQYNANRNGRNQRTSRPLNQDGRSTLDNRQTYDRSLNHRTSPRMHEQQMSPSTYRNRGDNLNHSHNSQPPSGSMDSNSNHLPPRERQSDGPPPAQRGFKSYRRRKEEEGHVRSMRQNSSSSSGGSMREKQALEPQSFDLEPNSFPPLPGPTPANSSSSNEVFESKLSDVVKGTAKPAPRENVVKPTVTVTPMVTTTNTATTAMSPPVKERPITPPPKKENISNNSGSMVINGVTSTSESCSTSSNCTPTRVPSPPPVSPQKPVKISGNSTEISPKHVEAHITPSKPVQPVSHMAKVQQVDKLANSPAKLSYAQMVQRGRDSDGTIDSKQLSDSDQEIVSNGDRPTLKEQSQTKTAKGVAKEGESARKENEPKEQRHFSSKRAKENREGRNRRRSEREGSRSSAK